MRRALLAASSRWLPSSVMTLCAGLSLLRRDAGLRRRHDIRHPSLLRQFWLSRGSFPAYRISVLATRFYWRSFEETYIGCGFLTAKNLESRGPNGIQSRERGKYL